MISPTDSEYWQLVDIVYSEETLTSDLEVTSGLWITSFTLWITSFTTSPQLDGRERERELCGMAYSTKLIH